MNTRRLTKKYKHKSRSKKSRKTRRSKRNGKTRRSGRSGRRVLKGGVPSVSRASSRASSGFGVSRRSGASSSAVISKHGDNFNFHDFYNKLMNTPNHELHSTLQDNKYMYIKNTTFQTFEPKGAYLNMTGLKFVNYLHGKFNNIEDRERKNHLKSIISQLDQNGMAQALKPHDLIRIEDNISPEYFKLYKRLYDAIYKKLFPKGNPYKHHLSTSVIIYKNLPPVVEE